MTALDPTGLLPDDTTLDYLWGLRKLTARAYNACHRAGLHTVGDVRKTGTGLRAMLRDDKATTIVLAAIRTDWADGADAEPVQAPEPEYGERDVDLAIGLLDEAEHRATVAEAKLSALTAAAERVCEYHRADFAGVHVDLRILLDQQRGGE